MSQMRMQNQMSGTRSDATYQMDSSVQLEIRQVCVLHYAKKVPKCPESLSYQKKDGRGRWACVAAPILLLVCNDTDFLFIFMQFNNTTISLLTTSSCIFFFFFFFGKVSAHPSFCMTTIQAIRDLFA